MFLILVPGGGNLMVVLYILYGAIFAFCATLPHKIPGTSFREGQHLIPELTDNLVEFSSIFSPQKDIIHIQDFNAPTAIEEAWVKLAWFEIDFSESVTAMVKPQVGSLDQSIERLV
jgi:hypothetical protein